MYVYCIYICILIIYDYYFSYFHIFWLPQFIRSFLWILFSSRWIPRFLKTELISAVCRIFSSWLFVFFQSFPFQVMQQFFSSRVCCDFCESFGREMSLNDANVNSSSDVKSSVKRWDYWSKILCTGWLFRFQQAGGPQESTREEESDFQAKSCESLYQWNQWIIRVFTTCFWFLSFWRGLEFWVLVSWQSWHWWPLFWFGESKC